MHERFVFIFDTGRRGDQIYQLEYHGGFWDADLVGEALYTVRVVHALAVTVNLDTSHLRIVECSGLQWLPPA